MPATASQKASLNAVERDALVLRHLPQVNYIARRIHDRLPPQVPLADLVQAGVVGLMDAMERFDAARGVQFASYAAFRIRGAILDSLREMDWSPRALRHKSRQVEDAAARLEQELGRAPSETELAAAMGLRLHDFRQVLTDIKGLDLFTLEMAIDPSVPDGACRDVPDTRQEGAFQRCLYHEVRHELAAAIARLPRKEQQVLALYYYEELTMSDIGRLLGVGESRVSQIHSMALIALRRRLARSLSAVRSATMREID
jgi:RNA polymerase sigma factor FliA